MARPTVFISYSHQDEAWKDRLVTHLGVLSHEGLLDLWNDRRIGAGQDWRQEIQEAMATASVAIMLVSCLAPGRDEEYRQRVAGFFQRLATPIVEEEKPQADPAFQRSLTTMLSAALGCAGLLFAAMGLVSIADPAGRLAMAAGVVCLLFSGGCLMAVRRKRRPPAAKS